MNKYMERRAGWIKAARRNGRHSLIQWRHMLREFKYKCVRCGSSLKNGGAHKDHIIPVSDVGSRPTDGIENIQPLCGKCNIGKSCVENFNWAEYRRKHGWNRGKSVDMKIKFFDCHTDYSRDHGAGYYIRVVYPLGCQKRKDLRMDIKVKNMKEARKFCKRLDEEILRILAKTVLWRA